MLPSTTNQQLPQPRTLPLVCLAFACIMMASPQASLVAALATPVAAGSIRTTAPSSFSFQLAALSAVTTTIEAPTKKKVGASTRVSFVGTPVKDATQKPRQSSSKSNNDDDRHWEVRLYNDENNYEFWVAAQLVKIAGLTERQAFDTMKLADATGQATIGNYECLEMAEYYHQALHAEGLAVDLLPVEA